MTRSNLHTSLVGNGLAHTVHLAFMTTIGQMYTLYWGWSSSSGTFRLSLSSTYLLCASEGLIMRSVRSLTEQWLGRCTAPRRAFWTWLSRFNHGTDPYIGGIGSIALSPDDLMTTHPCSLRPLAGKRRNIGEISLPLCTRYLINFALHLMS